jgi:hypothetical protein
VGKKDQKGELLSKAAVTRKRDSLLQTCLPEVVLNSPALTAKSQL